MPKYTINLTFLLSALLFIAILSPMMLSNVVASDSDYEPNDTKETASRIGEGMISGLVLSSGDQDWFVAACPAGDTIEFQINIVSWDGSDQVIIELYDSIYNLRGIQTFYPQSEGEQSLYIESTYAQDFYFKLSPISLSGDLGYSLTVDIGTPVVDSYEPNNDYFQATSLDEGVYSSIPMGQADDDWYSVNVPAGKDINVSVYLTERSSANYFIHGFLLDSNQNQLDSETASGSQEDVELTMSWHAENETLVYIALLPADVNEASFVYSMTIEFSQEVNPFDLEIPGMSPIWLALTGITASWGLILAIKAKIHDIRRKNRKKGLIRERAEIS